MNKGKTKVLHIVTSINTTGVSTLLYSYYTRMDHNKIHFDIVAIDCGHEQQMSMEFRKEGCSVLYMPKKYLARIPYLFKLFSKSKYDVVHSHIELANAVYLTIAWICGVKNRISHAHMAHHPYNGFTNFTLKIINQFVSTQFWGCSIDALINLHGHKIAEKKGYVMHNAINLDKFKYSEFHREEYRKKWMIRKDTIVLGFVGRFTEEKNIFFLLEIFECLKKIESNIFFITVGEGELFEKFMREITRKGIKDSILNLGSRKDVPEIMSAIDILLLPSKSEGLGIVLIEAQACGLPCIASKEKIPLETRVSNLIKYVSLSDSPSLWAYTILENKNITDRHMDMKNQLTQKHYNIMKEAPIIESLYITLSNEKRR